MDTLTALQEIDSIIKDDISPEWWEIRRATVFDEYSQGRLKVAVVGQFNAGKSTLINAILGDDLLPRGILPTTAVVAEVESSNSESYFRVEGHTAFEGGKEISIDREMFRSSAQGEGVPGEQALIRAYLPQLELAERVVLADTPGVGSLEKTHTEITYGYLGSADAVILVTDGERGSLQETQVRFLRDQVLNRTREKLIVVVTKLEGKLPDEAIEILEHIALQLSSEAGIKEPIVLRVDASVALEQALSTTSERNEGLAEFKSTLDSRFLAEAGRLRAERSRRTLARAVAEVAALLGQKQTDLDMDLGALQTKIADLSKSRASIREKRDRIEDRFRLERQELEGSVRSQVTRLLNGIAENAPRYVSEIENNPNNHERVSSLIRGDVARAVESLGDNWLEPAIRNLSKSIVDDLESLSVDLPGLAIPIPGNPGGFVIDVLVEGGLLVLLNLLLPGEWLVALVARVLGKRGIEILVDPVKKTVQQAVNMLLKNTIRTGLEATIRNSILAMNDNLVAALQEEIRQIIARIKNQILGRIDTEFEEITRATEDAKTERERGRDEAMAEVKRLKRITDQVQALVDETNPLIA